ncbi:MAG: GTP 3',8-cyclase MoaA [Anaerolineae bacterium]|nr:GTP 3',8-cyclase MoaA [Anaerolineae bacterium]
MPFLDGYQRPISYLRISVTDRCNLRCVYCMPPEGVPSVPHDEILRYEEIETVARAAAALGIHKVRLTGGEPLVRRGIADLVRALASIPGIDDLSMTTNGLLLPQYADDLARAGLRRVNVSLDTLRPDRYRQITRRGELSAALAGIGAAHAAGLTPVKINVVVVRGLNDDEVVDLARRTVSDGWNVRFIEWMPIGDPDVRIHSADWTVETAEVRAQIEAAFGPLQAAATGVGGGPARYYRVPGAAGTIGFISPLSEHFCSACNRLRLTADGKLRPCLLSNREIDLRAPLRSGAGVDEIAALLLQGIASKPDGHHLDDLHGVRDRTMSQIGG